VKALAFLACAVAIAVPPTIRASQSVQVALQRDQDTHPGPATLDVSADGALIAFASAARLSPVDSNSFVDVYILDRSSGRVTLESVAADGGPANGSSAHPRLSEDGRFLVFASVATNFGGPPTQPGRPQVFRRDRRLGKTQLVSHAAEGEPGNGWSGSPSVSNDGEVVAFESAATNLAVGVDANGIGPDVYVWDAERDALARASVSTGDVQSAAGWSVTPSVSGNGQYVAFVSSAQLDTVEPLRPKPSAAGAFRRVFLRDIWNRTTTLVSRVPGGVALDGYAPAINYDGHVVAFVSMSAKAGPRDRNRAADVFLHDIRAGTLMLVSRDAKGGSADGSSGHPDVSADGRYVVFTSEASNLTCPARCVDGLDLNLVSDIFRFDVSTGRVMRVSGPGPRGEPWWESSAGPAMDAAGVVIAFSSHHPISDADVDHDLDVFVQVLPAASVRR
jgi:Tol biopolymer transport system component